MKAAVYIENGLTQLVLTPENDFEKNALRTLECERTEIKSGSFYECQGGWVRQGVDDKSTILICLKKPGET